MWRLIYWTSFFLAWIILPMCQEYEEAGDFTMKQKLMRSIRNNLLFYAVMLAIGAVGLFYLIIKGGFSFSNLLTYAMAAGNCFGLLVLVILLSHGIP